MGRFKKWMEMSARIRARNAAADCLGAQMTTPHAQRTNIKAADAADEKGIVGGKKRRTARHIDYNLPPAKQKKYMKEDQTPNYSFDSFVKKAEEEKNKIASSIQGAREKEAELDNQEKELEKDSGPNHDDEDDKEEDKWKKLLKIHKDKEEKEEDSEEKSSSSDNA